MEQNRHEGHRKRLREKFILNGLDGFAEHEALEMILSFVIPRRDTNGLAHSLIARFGSINAVLSAQVNELSSVKGISERVAVFLKLFNDLPKYMHMRSGVKELIKLSNPSSAAQFALGLMKNERYESVYVLSLTKKHELINAERLFTGTISEAPFYPRLIVEAALRHKAYAALLLHNHPSGDPCPSTSDIQATKVVKLALNSIDIRLYDHIIVGSDSCYSVLRNSVIDSGGEIFEAPESFIIPGEAMGLAAAEKNL